MKETGGILAIWNDRDEAIAQEFERWYVTEHIPERLGVPGFLVARRYEVMSGDGQRFFTAYDLAAVDVLSSAAYLARLAAPSALTQRVMASFRNMVRTAMVPVRSPRRGARGGNVVVGWVRQPATVDKNALQQAADAWEKDPRVLGVRLWRAAPDAGAVSTESKLRPGADAKAELAVVVDVMREADALALAPAVAAALQGASTGSSARAAVSTNVYRLLGVWGAGE